MSKFRRKVNVRILLLWRNKKRNVKRQAAKEGFVIGVVYGVNGKT
jgi:hypothetical protein